MKQDRNGVRTAQDLERKYNLNELVGVKKMAELSVEGINKTNKKLEEFMSATVGDIEFLQSQIDGNITTYFYSGVPTLSTVPTSEWSKNEYDIHLGDLYYDTDTGEAYRFAKQADDYLWILIADIDVAEALKIANEAKDTADGKRRVFISSPIPPYDAGDLWLNNQELYVCITAKATGFFELDDFEKATKYTDDAALNTFINSTYINDLKAINEQIDKKSETWYQATDPSFNWTNEVKANHVGDLWYNTANSKSYIYTESLTWEEADGVPDNVYDAIDGKAQIFTSEPVPPYHVNDLYVQGEQGDILVCITERLEGSYSDSDWKKAGKYTDDTNLNQFVNVVYANDLENLTNQIDGKVTTWYYAGTPTLSNAPAKDWSAEEKVKHTGDLYYDKDTGRAYIFELENGVYTWELVKDQDIAQALALANAASDTADSKRRVFVTTPVPPYDNGDLWFNNQEIYICQISKGEGESYADIDFIIATKYTDDTVANQVGNNLEIVRGTVATIQAGVDAVKLEFETTVKTVDSLKQETTEAVEKMSYTFGTKDLTIASSNDPVNVSINNQGLKVFNYRTLQAIFNHRGTGVQKLIVTGDAQLANISIVKAKDENGNDCTDINHLVSNFKTLTDLEGGN